MKFSCLLLQATLVAVLLLPSPSQGHPQQPPVQEEHGGKIDFKGSFKKVFAFGGSSTDSGNARIMGILNTKAFEKLEAGSDDPAPIWATGSTGNLDRNGLCDGNLMIDFLCESLGLPKLEPYQKKGANFSHGANFAIAGCSVVKKAKTMFNLWWKTLPDSVQMQLQWFDSFVKVENKPTLNDALFWIGILGADDYAESGTIDYKGIANLNVQMVSNLISGLSAVGARFLVVQGLPPIGCIPSGLSVADPKDRDSDGCSAQINAAVMYHNDLLQKKIIEIQATNPNITIVFADTYKAFMKVFKNYQRFHFSEPIAACCGYGGGKLNYDLQHLCGSKESTVCADAAKHINWDGIHFTAAMYQHMSSLFLFGTCSYPTFGEVMPKVMTQIAKDKGEMVKAGVTRGAAAVGAAVRAHRAIRKAVHGF